MVSPVIPWAISGNVPAPRANLLPRAVRTATIDSVIIVNPGALAMLVFLEVFAASGLGGLTMLVRVPHPTIVPQTFYNMNSAVPAAPITTAGHRGMVVCPFPLALGGSTDFSASQSPIPDLFIVRVGHADASNYEYQLDYAFIMAS